jgi:hypothetical protein
MLANQMDYPIFVADQLLTTDALNAFFGYVEEQERLTRANFLGVGIVCGLGVQTAADGASITLSRGTGITSAGYMVAVESTEYAKYQPFDPARAEYYGAFLTADHAKKFGLWELKEKADVEDGATPLSSSFLAGTSDGDQKIVLLFVELLKEENKNCNPESCDDLGITVHVNVRPLLARKADVTAFKLDRGVQGAFGDPKLASLPELRVKRFDVPATGVSTAAELLTAYQKILLPLFKPVGDALHGAYTVFQPFVGSDFASDPFPDLVEKFSFVSDEAIDAVALQNLQYVYDYVADLMAAYAELRDIGMQVLTTCCPDSTLFPRHLLLGPAPAPAPPNPALRH